MAKRLTFGSALVLILIMVGQLSWSQNRRPAFISGSVTYRQRSALPPDASINIQLQDVSVQDAKTRVIAQVEIPSEGKQVPIDFHLPYKQVYIIPSHVYAVRAAITAGGNIIFTSTSSYRVITRGAPKVVSIMVEPVSSASSPKASGARPAKLDNWLGQWIGPEGTSLVLSRRGDNYEVKIRSLDAVQIFEGVPAGDRILFTRKGKSESIRAGDGKETGMKWLLDKKNCLIVQTGEGFCRD